MSISYMPIYMSYSMDLYVDIGHVESRFCNPLPCKFNELNIIIFITGSFVDSLNLLSTVSNANEVEEAIRYVTEGIIFYCNLLFIIEIGL
jgi:hypothetical protein